MVPSDLQGLTTDCSVYMINRFHRASKPDSQFPPFGRELTEEMIFTLSRIVFYNVI